MAKKSITITPGYVTTTTAMETKGGKDSAMRLVEPAETTVLIDSIPQKITDIIVQFVSQAMMEKAAKEAKEEAAEAVRVYASKVRTHNAKKGDYTKSLQLNGKRVKNMQYAVAAIAADKFSTPSKKEDITNLKEALGKPVFDTLFKEEATIAIRADVMENDDKRKELSRKLVELFGIDGIKEYFDRKTVLKTKEGLDKRQYALDEDVLQKLKDAKIKQAADSLKDVSDTIAE